MFLHGAVLQFCCAQLNACDRDVPSLHAWLLKPLLMCVLQSIDGLDADVLTIENSRSGDEMVTALAKYGYSRDLGAGVYDVHSPVVPRYSLLAAVSS